jgi:PAS domain S-box-containing protein
MTHDLSRPRPPSTEREIRLLSIIESAMDAIITIDEDQRVILFNRAAERVFGVDATAALGSSIDRFIPARFRKAHAEQVSGFGRTGETMRGMGRLGMVSGVRADGTEFPIEASISQTVSEGRRLYTVILRDISERKKLEEQLLHSQKTEGIGRLAGGIAHDFNNLLMAIFNYLTLASNKLESDHPARAALGHAHEAADRAAMLTRQLLTFARKQVAKPRVLSPVDVVKALEPMLQRLIGDDVALRTNLAPDTGNVLADSTQLEQVLVNLSVNARDAMPHGGTLAIESANVDLDADYCRTRVDANPGPHVMLCVSDSGEGMTPDVLARLFEPFFTTKAPGKGTGLGLATCHGIVRQSGGHIAVYSEPGRGTAVKVFLPRATQEKAAPAAAAPSAGSLRGSETVLLVEDNSIVRTLILRALGSAGYTVLVASSGLEALRIVESHPGKIDLLVTDVVMPVMSGVQLAEILAQKLPRLAIVYISGFTEESVADQGLNTNGRAFLSKPFASEVLLRTARELLSRKA